MARRRNFRLRQKINRLSSHYIICGTGELVDKTIGYVLHGAEIRRAQHQDASFRPIASLLQRLFGHPKHGHITTLRRLVRRLFLLINSLFVEHTTLLDLIVVITEDEEYAERLRSAGILVILTAIPPLTNRYERPA